MQKYIQNQIHKYKHTEPAGKQECFLHICQETLEYYKQGLLTEKDLVDIFGEFIQFKELLVNPLTREIIGLAGLLEVPEEIIDKPHKEIIQELTKTITLNTP